MTDERTWQLMIAKLSGEATPEQLAELEQALLQEPGLQYQFGMLETIWKSKQPKMRPDIDEKFNRHLQRLSNQMTNPIPAYEKELPAPRKINYVYLWRAGMVAAVLVLAFMIWNSGRHQSPMPTATAQNLVSTTNGSKSKLQLPDGTEVWLNAGSRISYGNDFTGATRQVSLYGEAYFDVVKDSARPFIIHTDAIDIRVLGTAFNVRSYPDEKVTETALIRGSVEITLHKNPGKKIMLRPNEKLIVQNDSASVSQTNGVTGNRQLPLMTLTRVHYVNEGHDSATMETLWTKNKLVFDGETLQQVALKLERWYGVKVVIQGDKLKNTEYNGVFEDENIAEVLFALKLSGDFNYTIRKNDVMIKP